MAHVQHNGKLNQLLVDIGRSLLQYVGECSAWTSPSWAEKEHEFESLVALQKEHVRQLVDLLMERGWSIDFGGFPATYTDLHFLSLKYLLKLTIESQKAVVFELDEAVHTCIDDPEGAALIREILTSERQISERLQSLASPATAVA